MSIASWIIFAGALLASLWMIRLVWREIVRTYREIFVWGPVKRRGEEMIRRAKALGKLWVSCTEEGTLAVCRRSLFDRELAIVIEMMKQSGRLKEPVRVEVYPTFTFAKQSEQFLAHTGNTQDGDRLLERLIFNLLGVRRGEISNKDYDTIISCLGRTDKRLYVPFVSSAKAERDLSRFSITSLEQAERDLMGN